MLTYLPCLFRGQCLHIQQAVLNMRYLVFIRIYACIVTVHIYLVLLCVMYPYLIYTVISIRC